MCRRCGYLALMSAIAGGAEAVLVPQFEPKPEEIMRAFKRGREQGKPHFIIGRRGSAALRQGVHEYVNEADGGVESRITVLGHVQRGGSPTAFDRILAQPHGNGRGQGALRR